MSKRPAPGQPSSTFATANTIRNVEPCPRRRNGWTPLPAKLVGKVLLLAAMPLLAGWRSPLSAWTVGYSGTAGIIGGGQGDPGIRSGCRRDASDFMRAVAVTPIVFVQGGAIDRRLAGLPSAPPFIILRHINEGTQ